MGIRLDAIPITSLPQIVQSDQGETFSTKVICVLHCEALSAHQDLEVSMNGVVLQPVQEGNQIVFSWQLVKAADTVQINLFKSGRVTRYWQGCWNERDAILQAGTLPVQVFFDGKRQPAMTPLEEIDPATPLTGSLPTVHQVNGNEPPPGIFQPEYGAYQSDDPTGDKQQSGELAVVQDLLVIAEAQPASTVQLTDSDRTEEEPEEMIEDEQGEERDGMDETITDEPGEAVENEVEKIARGEESKSFIGQEDSPTALPRLAAFHLSPLYSQKTLDALKQLMTTMSSKTILVDLRLHSRTKKKYQAQSGISKDQLRAAFGGKYWDRGWAIQTALRPASSEGNFSRWRPVVVDPDTQPDGIPSLIRHLQEGFSIIVMDSVAAYEESPRRGVIEELQKRLPGLVVGPVE